MKWTKGQSGNPKGRPKVPDDVRELARMHTPAALLVQVGIMQDAEAPAAARITAAENVINRAYGKPESTTNLNVGAGAAFIDMLRYVNERRPQDGAVADGVDGEPERPAAVRH